MPRLGLQPTIPVFQLAMTVHVLDSAATVIGSCRFQSLNYPITVYGQSVWELATSIPVFFLSFLPSTCIFIPFWSYRFASSAPGSWDLIVSLSVTWECVMFADTCGDVSWWIGKDLKVERHGQFVNIMPAVFMQNRRITNGHISSPPKCKLN
jgi:hypothetical protein